MSRVNIKNKRRGPRGVHPVWGYKNIKGGGVGAGPGGVVGPGVEWVANSIVLDGGPLTGCPPLRGGGGGGGQLAGRLKKGAGLRIHEKVQK